MTNTDRPDTPPEDQPNDKPADKAAREKKGLFGSLSQASWVEQLLAQARAKGAFDNLPGAGQPQQLDDESMVPHEYRLGNRMLKSNGFASPWIEARKDIAAHHAEVAAWLARSQAQWPTATPTRQAALRAEYRDRLKKLWSAILTYNLQVPQGVPHLPNIILEAELRKLGGDEPAP